jgi:hypothetical protein
MFFVGQTDLTDNDLVILDNIIFGDVNLFNCQVFINLFWIVEVFRVTDNLSFNKKSQTI